MQANAGVPLDYTDTNGMLHLCDLDFLPLELSLVNRQCMPDACLGLYLYLLWC